MFESRIICICGLPGIGSVGKVAADYLATALECSTIKPFYSRSFPPQVIVSQGITQLLHAELLKPKEKENMYILSGEAQPLDVLGMHRLAGDILEAAREKGVSDVITLAAYVGDTKEKVLGAASDNETVEALREHNIPLLCSGAIGGLNGLLAGLAPLHNMRGICLLGTSSGQDPVDLCAATNLLEAVNDLLCLGLEISLIVPEIESTDVQFPEEIDMNYR
ncbi:PAC2 family protein [uncultured archaeon]|nr:PAC2 family protein [uncultured archaeon]